MSRFRASFYHLLISGVVFFALAYLVLFVWYPDFFYSIDGGWEGMRIIIGVDLVLGPLLTLIVFKAGKPGLKFDLAAIGIVQVLCLIAGTYVVYLERPLFFVFYDDHFYSANRDTFDRYGRKAPDPARFGGSTPAFVIAKVPDNPIEEADFRRILFQDGLPVWIYERTYEPLGQNMDRVMKGAFPIEKLRLRDRDGQLSRWLEKQGGTIDDYAFFPVHSRYRDPFVAIRKADRSFVDLLELPAPLG